MPTDSPHVCPRALLGSPSRPEAADLRAAAGFTRGLSPRSRQHCSHILQAGRTSQPCSQPRLSPCGCARAGLSLSADRRNSSFRHRCPRPAVAAQGQQKLEAPVLGRGGCVWLSHRQEGEFLRGTPSCSPSFPLGVAFKNVRSLQNLQPPPATTFNKTTTTSPELRESRPGTLGLAIAR